MSTTEWLTLESFLDGMTEALKNHSERQVEETWFLGSNIFVKASKDYPLLDLRHYWKPDPNEGRFRSNKKRNKAQSTEIGPAEKCSSHYKRLHTIARSGYYRVSHPSN